MHASVVCFNIHRKIHEKELRVQPPLSNHNNNKVKIAITNYPRFTFFIRKNINI